MPGVHGGDGTRRACGGEARSRELRDPEAALLHFPQSVRLTLPDLIKPGCAFPEIVPGRPQLSAQRTLKSQSIPVVSPDIANREVGQGIALSPGVGSLL
jgi:hypothetical protein